MVSHGRSACRLKLFEQKGRETKVSIPAGGLSYLGKDIRKGGITSFR
jgi:hypothetical protein